MSSSDPIIYSHFVIRMFCGLTSNPYWKIKQIVPFFSPSLITALWRYLVCYSKISLTFCLWLWWLMYVGDWVVNCLSSAFWEKTCERTSQSVATNVAGFCQFSKSVFLLPSHACLNTSLFESVFFHPSCDRYCTLQLVDQRWFLKRFTEVQNKPSFWCSAFCFCFPSPLKDMCRSILFSQSLVFEQLLDIYFLWSYSFKFIFLCSSLFNLPFNFQCFILVALSHTYHFYRLS
jgi:hypothetical protein